MTTTNKKKSNAALMLDFTYTESNQHPNVNVNGLYVVPNQFSHLN